MNAIAQRFGREAGKYNRVDSADTRAGEKDCDGLPRHRKVNGDGIAFLETEGFENIGDAADFAEKLGVSDFPSFSGLISLVDDGGLFVL